MKNTIEPEIKVQRNWKNAYAAPRTRRNPTRCWQLPSCDQIIEDLRACGGDTAIFVSTLSKNTTRQQILLTQIFERFEDKSFAAQWHNVLNASKLAEKVMREVQFTNGAMSWLAKQGG